MKRRYRPIRTLAALLAIAGLACAASLATAAIPHTPSPPEDERPAPPDSLEHYLLPDLVVESRGPDQEPTRRKLSRPEVERIAGFGGDVIKSLQSLPGVARPGLFTQGFLVVRGSGLFDTRYLLDGVDIPLLFHYGGVKSTYNSQALGGIDMYPGGFGVRYGGCVGGVVEVRGRSGRMDKWHREVDVSLFDSSVLVEGPLGRDVSLLVNVRRSYAGEVIDRALAGNDDVRMGVVPYYWDVVARLDWTPSLDDAVFLTWFAAKDRMELVFPGEDLGSADVAEATDSLDMDVYFKRLILGWDRHLGGSLKNEMRAALGSSEEHRTVFGFFRMDSEVPIYSLRDELIWTASPDLTLRAAADMIWAPASYDVEAAGWPGSIEDETFADLGFYLNGDVRLGDDTILSPGLRWDHYPHLKEGAGSARLAARHLLNDRHTLTAAVGTYNQTPQPIGQTTDPVYGNPDLPPTTAFHAVVGDEIALSDRVSAKVDVYYNSQDKIPAFAEEEPFLPDADGRMYGLEVMLRYHGGDRFFGWLALGLSRSERRYARPPSPDVVDWNPDDWLPYEFDQPLHLEAVGSWRLGRSWSVGGRLQAVSGNPESPLLSYTEGIYEFDADTGDYVPVTGDYLADRFAPFVRLDVRVDRTFGWFGADWSAYLDVQNASTLLYDSPEGYIYNYDFSKREAYGWYVLPTLGLRVGF